MSLSESTTPLDDEYRDTLEYCGRTFHKYSLETGTYFAPVDEEEIERLELMHNVLSKVFDNRLIFPPMPAPRKILDCGCGAANWAVDVAEQYPDCEVLGIDVSPHMLPEHPPRNFDFQIDDLNARCGWQGCGDCSEVWLTSGAGLHFRITLCRNGQVAI
ncbi:hypothetical protein NHJ13734_008088 [Beauveria thailandica]